MHTSSKIRAGKRIAPGRPTITVLGLAALLPIAAHAQTQDLFVSNQNTNTISRFAGTGPGTFSTTATTLSGGLNGPAGLAIDTGGDLFVASFRSNSVSEYAFNAGSGTFGPSQTIATGLSSPSFLAFGPSVAPVPEASTTASFGLLALGMGGLVMAARRKKSTPSV